MKKFLIALQKKIGKEKVSNRLIDRLALSSDAGFYRLIPQIIVRPNCEQDILILFQLANEYKVAVVFRAAGTSLSGQSISDSVLIDISRSFRDIQIKEQAQKVQVGVGIIGEQVNQHLRPFFKKIGPDPASIQAAMMGGILSNNSSGMCCGVKDNAYHTLDSMRAILPNGFVFDSNSIEDEKILANQFPHIHNGLLSIRSRILSNPKLLKKIRHKYKIKNTMGYSINAFVDYQKPLQILSHLLIGSEGTLGFISTATLKTIPSYPYKITALLFFENIFLSSQAVPQLLDAASVELMDRNSLRSIESSLQKNSKQLGQTVSQLSNTATALLVEYQFLNSAIRQSHAQAIHQKLHSLCSQVFISEDIQEQALYWSLRKGLYPSVGSLRPVGSTALIEDVAVEVKYLANFVLDLQEIFLKYNYNEAILFGHAKDGNLHFVITPSFDNEAEILRYQNLMAEVVDLVLYKYQGSLKGEHGTGRNMAPFVEEEWGEELYLIMKELKTLLDPHNICNPGVILNDDSHVHLKNLKQLPPVDSTIDLCIECGFCEHNCPSRNVTLTPRQRISIWRYLQNDFPFSKEDRKQLLQDYPYQSLDTCATDGVCALACPVNIDTGVYVKKIRAQQHKEFANFFSKQVVSWLRLITFFLRLFLKALTKLSLKDSIKTLTLFLRKFFVLPVFFPTLSPPDSKAKTKQIDNPDFIYFSTCIARTMGGYSNEKDLSHLLLHLSKKAGYQIRIPKTIAHYCCGMPFSSKGYNQAYQKASQATWKLLQQESQNGKIPVLVDTSSCTYTLLQEQEKHEDYSSIQIIDVSEFAANYLLPRFKIRHKQNSVALHITCAARKINAENFYHQIAQACAKQSSFPLQESCCGMAGDRGMFYPELIASAQADHKVEQHGHQGYYSLGKTCEAGLSHVSGHEYLSLLHLLEKTIEK